MPGKVLSDSDAWLPRYLHLLHTKINAEHNKLVHKRLNNCSNMIYMHIHESPLGSHIVCFTFDMKVFRYPNILIAALPWCKYVYSDLKRVQPVAFIYILTHQLLCNTKAALLLYFARMVYFKIYWTLYHNFFKQCFKLIVILLQLEIWLLSLYWINVLNFNCRTWSV